MRNSGTSPGRHSRTPKVAVATFLSLLVFILVSSTGMLGAAAASFGGLISSSIAAETVQPPLFIASLSDNFAGNGNLNAPRILATGQPWNVNSGGYRTQAGQLRTNNSGAGPYVASLPWLRVNTQVQADLSTTNQAQIGLFMQGTTSDTGTVLRVANNGNAQLGYINGGVFTQWASGVGSANGTWSLSYFNGDYTVARNSVTIFTYTLPVGDRPTVEANGRVGVYSTGNTGQGRWDNFSAVTLL